MQQQDNHEYPFLYQRQTCHQVQPNQATYQKRQKCQPATYLQEVLYQLALPTGSVDPNFGRRVRNRRQLNSLQNTWPYGYSMPIAVRYTQDAFSRSGWLWPVDAKGEPLKATSYMAVGFYVAKYVNKKSDMDL